MNRAFLLLVIISVFAQILANAQSKGCDEEARRILKSFNDRDDFEGFRDVFCTPDIRQLESRLRQSLKDSQCKVLVVDGLLFYANRATSTIANDRVAIKVWTKSLNIEPSSENDVMKHLVRLNEFDELLDSMIDLSEDLMEVGTFEHSPGTRPVEDFTFSPRTQGLPALSFARIEALSQAIALDRIMAELKRSHTYAQACASIVPTEARQLDEIRLKIDQRLREHVTGIRSLKSQLNANRARVIQ